MHFTLYNRAAGERLLRRTGEHWWLTGFKWGYYVKKPSDLEMVVEITFPDADMQDAFIDAAAERGYTHSVLRSGRSVHFTFAAPKTVQPGSRAWLEEDKQTKNADHVENYHAYKDALGLAEDDNDPNHFGKQSHVSKRIEAFLEKPKPIKRPSPTARSTQDLSAARGKLLAGRPRPGRFIKNLVSDIRDTRDSDVEIFDNFYNKLWKVTP